jgi:hypothetical protein
MYFELKKNKRKIEKLEKSMEGKPCRQKIEELESLKQSVKEIESMAPKAGTPPSKERRATCHTPITCRTFGPDRKQIWKDQLYYFCDACDQYDGLRPELKRKYEESGVIPKRYQCKANHTSKMHLTHIAEAKYVMKKRDFSKKNGRAPAEAS